MAKKRNIVVKIGSALLANLELLTPRYGFLQRLLEDVAQLRAEGTNVILCSSGSVALGLRIIGETPESAGVSDKQAAAACGMPLLLNAYKQVGHEFGFEIAQVLLTLGDFEDHRRFLNTRNTVHRLLEANVVPIVNENDTITTEEIRVGDNDRLAARIAQAAGADAVLLIVAALSDAQLFAAKRDGFTDIQVAHLVSTTEEAVWQRRRAIEKAQITRPVRKLADGDAQRLLDGRHLLLQRTLAVDHANDPPALEVQTLL